MATPAAHDSPPTSGASATQPPDNPKIMIIRHAEKPDPAGSPYGVTPHGLLYYAMEYIEGLTLSTLVNRFGPLSDGRTIHLLTQACRSLQEAHDCGLIHRDVKPDNIFLVG